MRNHLEVTEKAEVLGLLGISNQDMQNLLRAHHLPVSGTRNILGQRIIDLSIAIPSENLFEDIPDWRLSPLPNQTRVVNVEVKYIRPQYNNLKEWCEDPNNIYIGRGGIVFVEIDGQKVRYLPQSIWHNPYKIKEYGDQTLQLFEQYIRNVPFLDRIEELRGKNLGCCGVDSDNPEIRYHGHILIQILNERTAY